MRSVTAILLITTVVSFLEMQYHIQILNKAHVLDILDVKPFWTEEAGMELLKKQGPRGRSAYREMYIGLRLGGDLAFPFLYGGLLISLLSEFKSKYWLLPIVTILADVAENLSVVRMIDAFPHVSFFAKAGMIFTPLKWVSLVACFVLLFMGSKKIKKK